MRKSAEHTELVDVILGLSQCVHVWESCKLLLGADTPCLGHQDQLMARDVVLLDSLPNDPLTVAVGVDVGGIPLFV